MKVIIVGGVAGGASCAARLRRLDEKAEILMVERGPYVSYANCGLPYHVVGCHPGGVEPAGGDRADVPRRLRVDVRTGCEAVAIAPKKKTVDLRDVTTGEVTTESYDKLVLSPGAAPIRPPLPGIDLPGHLLREDRPGRPAHPRVAAPRRGDEDRDGLVHGHPDRDEAEARGRGRRRVHRPRDGGEPRPPRARGDARREAEPGHAAARPRDGAARRALPREARRAPRSSTTASPGSGRPRTARSRS